jgi:creatinine amidohydrolase/Fe(II)-dependent formamide hydrolase-like protein
MYFGYPIDLTGTDDRDAVKVCNEWVAGDIAGAGKVFWSTWALQTSDTGVLGDPSCATAETGKACMEAIVEQYCYFLKYFWEQETPVR